MSLIVTTDLGRFRKVTDQGKSSFLFECPLCQEWLPLAEEHLNGSRDITHSLKGQPEIHCDYSEPKAYGAVLVSTIQARILMAEEGVKPYDTDYRSLELGE